MFDISVLIRYTQVSASYQMIFYDWNHDVMKDYISNCNKYNNKIGYWPKNSVPGQLKCKLFIWKQIARELLMVFWVKHNASSYSKLSFPLFRQWWKSFHFFKQLVYFMHFGFESRQTCSFMWLDVDNGIGAIDGNEHEAGVRRGNTRWRQYHHQELYSFAACSNLHWSLVPVWSSWTQQCRFSYLNSSQSTT